jgi:hypothetical protein
MSDEELIERIRDLLIFELDPLLDEACNRNIEFDVGISDVTLESDTVKRVLISISRFRKVAWLK